MDEQEIQEKIKKLRNLSTCKNKTDEELREMVLRKASKKSAPVPKEKSADNAQPSSVSKSKIELGGYWKNPDEENKANALFQEYLKTYNFTLPGDVQLLRQKVMLEISNDRIQEVLADTASDKNGKNYVNDKVYETFRKNCEAINELNEALGICQHGENENDPWEKFQQWKKKVLLWLKMNPNKTRVCPHCQKMIFLKLKDPQLYEALKHPYYRDKFLWNDALFDLVEAGKITADEAAGVLKTHADYIRKCLEKRQKIINPLEP
jgi:hypothetical protein